MAQACRLGLLLALLLPVVGASLPSTVVRLNKAMLSYGKRCATVLAHVRLSPACARESKSACMYNSTYMLTGVHVPMNAKASKDLGLICHCVPGPQCLTSASQQMLRERMSGVYVVPQMQACCVIVLTGLSGVGTGQFGNSCLCVSVCKFEN